MRGSAAIKAIATVAGLALLAAVAHADEAEVLSAIRAKALFFEDFNDGTWSERWRHSSDPKYTGRFGTHKAKEWTNQGLRIPDKSKHYGLSALLPAPVEPVVGPGQPLVVQYEVKYNEGIQCGGSYLKLLSADPDLTPERLVDSTPYSIMFGPDRCGAGKVHLIFRHKHAKNGTVSEKHLVGPPQPEVNDYTHLYTLKITPDHQYEIRIDGDLRASGSLLNESALAPPLLPPADVPDPEDVKPADWVDLSVIPDPKAVKPADWDEREKIEDPDAKKPKGWMDNEPKTINDPAARRPADWDDEEDGVWEPPQIPNPKCKKAGCGPWQRPLKANPAYKGAWKAPLIDNPDYKGPWVQRRIPNPHHYEDPAPLSSGVAPIGGVALELWTTDSGYMFDNVLITRDPATAELALERLWRPRYDAEKKAFEKGLKEAEEREKERKKADKEKARREKKARRKADRRGSEALDQLVDWILALFDKGGKLEFAAPYARPLTEWLRDNPDGIVLLLGVTPLMLLTFLTLYRTFGPSSRDKDGEGQRSRAALAAAKRTDAPVPDQEDEPEQEEAAGQEDEEAEEVPDAVPLEGAEVEPEPAAKEAAVKEPEIEKQEEEEEEEPTKGARRRTRRAA
ncbi:hypothetical protein HYH03_007489 [Edaphochlamys debaryana]|uniref:Calnexin n=1 Tax=Edaphochlamys debaryana TaxID=47281 RepID=A0A835Y3C7_9CHLO|nr:hypothetical protein HYH03_007489 [Edaphochlamys debaryana]|eukprot:KAG2494437.1 hypothetical protein HYH03_007489 [Edaphochlamys debaryana]